MACPKRYEYAIIDGWRKQGQRIDLDFGILYHNGLAEGMKVWAAGGTRDEAQMASLNYVLDHSGEYVDEPLRHWVPWSGSYIQQWRCLGEKEYRNEKNNVAKCPFSHRVKGDYRWFFGFPDLPDKCPTCGSGVHSESRWVPEDKAKDRYGLVRAVVWYWEEQPQDREKGLQIVTLPSGRPAVELSFRIPSGFQNSYGEDYILCGHIDRLTRLAPGTAVEQTFFNDYKTTKKALNRPYFAGYSPDVQMDHYDLSVSIMFPGMDIKGGIVEGIQVLTEGARFLSKPLYRTESMRQEYVEDLDYWLGQAERFAQENHWPRNRASCMLCEFKEVCSKPQGISRENALKADFIREPWNPLAPR